MFGQIILYYRNRQFHDARYCISLDLKYYSEFDGRLKEKDMLIRSYFERNGLVYEDYELFDVMVYIGKGEPLKNPKAEVKINE